MDTKELQKRMGQNVNGTEAVSAVDAIVMGEKRLVADPWWEFDFWWEQKKEELERVAWNCKGTFGGYIPPFPSDIIRQEVHNKMLEWNEKQIYELMGVPEKYMRP